MNQRRTVRRMLSRKLARASLVLKSSMSLQSLEYKVWAAKNWESWSGEDKSSSAIFHACLLCYGINDEAAMIIDWEGTWNSVRNWLQAFSCSGSDVWFSV